jgi:CheY-like chemotaxis protein
MRVLVVEDEASLADGLRAGLSAEGFAVDVAPTGTDGLWLAREQPFDAIVLDIMLPGVNGYRICQLLRAERIWTPVLLLTAKDGEWDEVEGLDTGADDYLTKPFLARGPCGPAASPAAAWCTGTAGGAVSASAPPRRWRVSRQRPTSPLPDRPGTGPNRPHSPAAAGSPELRLVTRTATTRSR